MSVSPDSASPVGYTPIGAGSPTASDSPVTPVNKRSLAYYISFPLFDPAGFFAPWDSNLNMKVHRLSDDLGIKVYIRLHTGQLSGQLGSIAPNFYTPTHNHVHTKLKVVREGALFVYNSMNSHTQKYTFPGKQALKLETSSSGRGQ